MSAAVPRVHSRSLALSDTALILARPPPPPHPPPSPPHPSHSSLHDSEYSTIRERAENVCKAKQPFERIVLSKAQALRLFADNPFKTQLIATKIPDGGYTTAYRCGPLIDLCRGPHVPTTASIKAFEVTKHSSS